MLDRVGALNSESSDRNENTSVNSENTENTNHPVRSTEISYPRNAKKNIKSNNELIAANITIILKLPFHKQARMETLKIYSWNLFNLLKSEHKAIDTANPRTGSNDDKNNNLGLEFKSITTMNNFFFFIFLIFLVISF